MNTPPQFRTGSQIDEIYQQAASYKKTAKVLSIISYGVLLLGIIGFIPFAGIGFVGVIFGLHPVSIGFILWILMQLVAEILRVAARKKLSSVSGAVDSEVAMLKKRNRRNYLIFFVCMVIIGGALLATVLLNR